MRDANLSLTKRIEALEARLAHSERAATSQAQRASAWQWPRDCWLGRTTSSSYSNYPATGDTFQVKLLSNHFTATEGTRAVTEHERGTIVVARTWPAKYLARDTDVIVKRMRGIGPSGAGEWWIETPESDGGDPVLFSWTSVSGRNSSSVLTNQMLLGVAPDASRMTFSGANVAPSSLFSVSDAGVMTCLRAGRYACWLKTDWLLYNVNQYSVAAWLKLTPEGAQYGPWVVSVRTSFAEVVATGFNGGYSELPILFSDTGYWSYRSMSHAGLYSAELAVGDTLTPIMSWDVTQPNDIAYRVMPTAEFRWFAIKALYCGDSTNV